MLNGYFPRNGYWDGESCWIWTWTSCLQVCPTSSDIGGTSLSDLLLMKNAVGKVATRLARQPLPPPPK
jgi:hypothetical protein